MNNIPCLFLPSKDIMLIRDPLLQIAASCIAQRESETRLLMKLAITGTVPITTKYDIERFGFGPSELVMTPNGTISLSVGITADLANPVVWFVSGHELPGVSYWPGANNPAFFANNGFARIVAGD